MDFWKLLLIVLSKKTSKAEKWYLQGMYPNICMFEVEIKLIIITFSF